MSSSVVVMPRHTLDSVRDNFPKLISVLDRLPSSAFKGEKRTCRNCGVTANKEAFHRCSARKNDPYQVWCPDCRYWSSYLNPDKADRRWRIGTFHGVEITRCDETGRIMVDYRVDREFRAGMSQAVMMADRIRRGGITDLVLALLRDDGAGYVGYVRVKDRRQSLDT